MFRARVILFLLVFSLFTLSLRANTVGAGGASDALVFYFDESGNGAFATNGGPLTPDPGILATDPNTGELALLYQLPVLVNSGDVTVTEPGGGVSDLLRFTDRNGVETGNHDATQMFYYSDNLDGADSLADVGIPTILVANGTIAEVGPEGNNGFDWQPDGAPYPTGNEYFGTSDTPEPGTMSLVGLGLGLTFVAKRLRKKVAHA
jgi:hypothetical protein